MRDGFWAGRRVLVTGHTGFKGSWLCSWLVHEGAAVTGFSDGIPTTPALFEEARLEEVVDSVDGDVRDAEAVRETIEDAQPDTIFHLAAQAIVRRSYAEPLLTYETNVLGTAHVLEAAARTGTVRACVVATTDKVYAPATGRRHVEEDALGGTDPYSTSKAAAELVVAGYRAANRDGPAVATVRAGNVIGGGDWAADRLVPDVVAAIAEARPLELRYPDAVRPWQHVLNPLDGYLILAERLHDDPSSARAWNFGPDGADLASVRSLAERVAELWGAPLRIDTPASPQPHEAPSLELDSTAARGKLGWTPRWDLDAGLEATVAWYRRRADGEPARSLVQEQIAAYADARLVAHP